MASSQQIRLELELDLEELFSIDVCICAVPTGFTTLNAISCTNKAFNEKCACLDSTVIC